MYTPRTDNNDRNGSSDGGGRMRTAALRVTSADGGFPTQRTLQQVVDDVIGLLVQYHGFDPDRFQNAQRRDHLEWEWRIIQLLRSNGSVAVKRAGLVAPVHPVPVKAEFAGTDFAPPTGCCNPCKSVVKNQAPPHSDAGAKRSQRNHHLGDVAEALGATAGSGAVVNILQLDDVLDGKLLTEEIFDRFPAAAGRIRVFTPNLNPVIVEKLRALKGIPVGGVVTGVGCVCNFLSHWEPFIVRTGGFAVVFADVHDRTAAAVRRTRGGV
jgi:hypothetical protein